MIIGIDNGSLLKQRLPNDLLDSTEPYQVDIQMFSMNSLAPGRCVYVNFTKPFKEDFFAVQNIS